MTKKKDPSPKPFSPFAGFLSEMLSPADISAIRVDRDDELHYCYSAICERQNHLFVYGHRGVGKTFLMHLLIDYLHQNALEVFPCHVNLVRDLPIGYPDSIATGFPAVVLRQLCVSLWRDLLGHSTSDLRGALSESPATVTLRRESERKVIEVYRLLRLEIEKMHYNREDGLGAALGLKADMKEVRGKEWTTGLMIVSEFLDLLDELFEKVCRPRNIDKFVLVCDEANHLPFRDQQGMLLRYVELFSAKHTQFVMVLRPEVAVGAQAVFSAFDKFELKGFSSRDYIAELLKKHLAGTEVQVTEDGLQVLWEVFTGHPLYTILTARRAYEVAVKAGSTCLDGRMLAVAAACQLREMHAHELMIAQQSVPPERR